MNNSAVAAVRNLKKNAKQRAEGREKVMEEQRQQIANNLRVSLEESARFLSAEIEQFANEEKWEMPIWQKPPSPELCRSKFLIAFATKMDHFFADPSHGSDELVNTLTKFLESHYGDEVKAFFCLQGAHRRIILWWGDKEPKSTAL